MKFKIKCFKLLIICVLAIFFVACKKEVMDTLSEQDKNDIISSYYSIDNELKRQLDLGNGSVDFEKIISDAQLLPMVEDVWVEKEKTLFVKFKKGGSVCWLERQELVIPPFLQEDFRKLNEATSVSSEYSSSLNKSSRGKVCLINQVFHDIGSNYESVKVYINSLNSQFTELGYDVEVKNGFDVNLNFLGNDLNKYDIFYFIAHGAYSKLNHTTWLATGDTTNLATAMKNHLLGWKDGQLCLIRELAPQVIDGKEVTYLGISDKFIDAKYRNKSFPNSIFYTSACSGLKATSTLGKVLEKKGVGVTIGWDNDNNIGHVTGYYLFPYLFSGATVGETVDDFLPYSLTHNTSHGNNAKLVYYPSTGSDLRLNIEGESSGEINIHSPNDGHTTINRLLNISGKVEGFISLSEAFVTINKNAYKLNVDNEGNFSQNVLLENGNNEIHINCYGLLKGGWSGAAAQKIAVKAEFEEMPLFTALTWNTDNTDIDLHLLAPYAELSSLWGGNDCFFGNMSTSWGAFLDVDNQRGRGPEHITVPVKIENPNYDNGDYTLYIHFYRDHGGGDTDVFLAVSTLTETMNFGPLKLEKYGNNLLEVCKINYTTGKIVKVEEYRKVDKQGVDLHEGKEAFVIPQKEDGQ